MKKISAEIIADSTDGRGNRITTMVLTFPRFILAELNTHRMFSRNSASSRAVPFKAMVEMVKDDPFIPIAWQKDHKGMQGVEYIENRGWELRIKQWLIARDNAVEMAESLNEPLKTFGGSLVSDGVTKQLCNRLLEPFMWHTCIITATEFDNFFKLRCPVYEHNSGEVYRSIKDFKDREWEDFCSGIDDVDTPFILDKLARNIGQSEIHMMELAECMWDAMNESTPTELKPGEWHIPFGDSFDMNEIDSTYFKLHPEDKDPMVQISIDYEGMKRKISTARCARVSYLNYEGKDDYEADCKLYDRLLSSGHMSPFEHVAQCMTDEEYKEYRNLRIVKRLESKPELRRKGLSYGWCRNFRGFIQLRETIE